MGRGRTPRRSRRGGAHAGSQVLSRRTRAHRGAGEGQGDEIGRPHRADGVLRGVRIDVRRRWCRLPRRPPEREGNVRKAGGRRGSCVRRYRARTRRDETGTGCVAEGVRREGHRGAQRHHARTTGRAAMTTGRPARPTTSIAAPVGEGSGDSFLRQRGRALILCMYTALRSLKLYPAGHATVQRALDDLTGTTREIVESEQDLELRISGEFIFVNGTRLRLDLDNYAAFSHVMSVFRVCGIGVLHVDGAARARDWQILLALCQGTSPLAPDDRLLDLGEALHKAGVMTIALSPPA